MTHDVQGALLEKTSRDHRRGFDQTQKQLCIQPMREKKEKLGSVRPWLLASLMREFRLGVRGNIWSTRTQKVPFPWAEHGTSAESTRCGDMLGVSREMKDEGNGAQRERPWARGCPRQASERAATPCTDLSPRHDSAPVSTTC